MKLITQFTKLTLLYHNVTFERVIFTANELTLKLRKTFSSLFNVFTQHFFCLL